MICKNCGKEIPDGSQFCGWCGASALIEETEEPAAVEPKEEIQLILPQDEAAEPVPEVQEETIAETVPEEPVQEPVYEEPAEEPVYEESVPEPKKEKKIHIQFNKEDYLPILGVLKNPFEPQRLAWPAIGVLLLVILCINWLVFRQLGGFGTALAVTLLLYAGTFLILFINGSKPFRLKNLCGLSAEIMTVPAVIMLIGGVVSLFQAKSMIAFAVASALLILAMVLYVLILEKHADKLNKYLLAVLIAAFFSLIVILQSNAFAAMIAGLAFPG